jgi:hypothetical protein
MMAHIDRDLWPLIMGFIPLNNIIRNKIYLVNKASNELFINRYLEVWKYEAIRFRIQENMVYSENDVVVVSGMPKQLTPIDDFDEEVASITARKFIPTWARNGDIVSFKFINHSPRYKRQCRNGYIISKLPQGIVLINAELIELSSSVGFRICDVPSVAFWYKYMGKTFEVDTRYAMVTNIHTINIGILLATYYVFRVKFNHDLTIYVLHRRMRMPVICYCEPAIVYNYHIEYILADEMLANITRDCPISQHNALINI